MNITPENPQPSALERFVNMITLFSPHHEGTARAVMCCPYVVPQRVAAIVGIYRPASYAECAAVILNQIEERSEECRRQMEAT